MKIYNTLTRKKEEFTPFSKEKVNMYACGVTPYDDIHIGHARQAVVYDVIRTYLEYLGYEVKYVRNFTDIDDKIIKRAEEEGKESLSISEHYIKENSDDLRKLKVRDADYEPKVTECIEDIIKYIEVLIEKGFAYTAGGDVFFEVSKFKDYGKLSNRKIEDLINSEESPYKKSNNDFALWKAQKPGEPGWDSPWSKGRPGWHIECSVMADKCLGDEIDIHGGGMDLIFPHHENEIAQSEAYCGKVCIKYWMHNGLVMINGTKMSKSLGNFLTVKDALKRYFPEEIRYAILTHAYGSEIDFSDSLFTNARKRMHYFYTTLLRIKEFKPSIDSQATVSSPIILSFESKFREYMNDNFNTARVISEITEVFKELNKIMDSDDYSNEEKGVVLNYFLEVFGKIKGVLRLFEEEPDDYLEKLKEKIMIEKGVTKEDIVNKIKQREEAKKAKNYKRADEIKEELKEKGVLVQDLKDEVRWDFILN